MDEDQRIAHSMFNYGNKVSELRAIDEQERRRRSSLDYNATTPVVHNSNLAAAFKVLPRLLRLLLLRRQI